MGSLLAGLEQQHLNLALGLKGSSESPGRGNRNGTRQNLYQYNTSSTTLRLLKGLWKKRQKST